MDFQDSEYSMSDQDNKQYFENKKIIKGKMVKKSTINEKVRRATIKKGHAAQIDAMQNNDKGICITEQSQRISSRLNEKSEQVYE